MPEEYRDSRKKEKKENGVCLCSVTRGELILLRGEGGKGATREEVASESSGHLSERHGPSHILSLEATPPCRVQNNEILGLLTLHFLNSMFSTRRGVKGTQILSMITCNARRSL